MTILGCIISVAFRVQDASSEQISPRSWETLLPELPRYADPPFILTCFVDAEAASRRSMKVVFAMKGMRDVLAPSARPVACHAS